MAKKTNEQNNKDMPDAYIENAGVVVEEKITTTLEKNYMPYAMSVIVSRITSYNVCYTKLLRRRILLSMVPENITAFCGT